MRKKISLAEHLLSVQEKEKKSKKDDISRLKKLKQDKKIKKEQLSFVREIICTQYDIYHKCRIQTNTQALYSQLVQILKNQNLKGSGSP